jgi:hypothetical protein
MRKRGGTKYARHEVSNFQFQDIQVFMLVGIRICELI